MIRIKNYIFNENDVLKFSQSNFDGKRVIVDFKNTDRFISIENTTLEDIEWNYGVQVSSQVSGQVKELEDRIDKAIEYINKFDSIKAYFEYIDEDGYYEYDYDDNFRTDLLKILKGEENESN